MTDADWFPDEPLISRLLGEAMAAEKAWESELSLLFPRQSHAARYDDRGTSTPRLENLFEAKRSTYQAFRVAAFPHASR